MRRRLIVASSTLFAIAVVAWPHASAAPLDARATPPQANLRLAQTSTTPGRLPPPVKDNPNDQGPAPRLDEFVLYAQRSILLTAGEKVTGNVGVHAAAFGLAGSQLHVGAGSQISKLLIAPSVDVASGVTFAGVLTNQFIQAGSPAAAQPFPAVNMPPLPYLHVPPAAGSNTINVPAGTAMTLGPGSYAALTVGQAGVLRLQPGEYVFSQVTVGEQATVAAEVGAAPNQAQVIIRVLGSFTAVGKAVIRPVGAQNLTASAGHLTIFVYGSDVRTDTTGGANTSGAVIGQGSNVTALLAAPRGTLLVDSGVQATGAFAAYDIIVRESTTIAFQDGFPNVLAAQLGSQKLQGYLPAHPNNWPVVGPVPLDTKMTLTVGLPVRAPQGFPTLKDFIKQVSDPKQPATFRHFLTPAEFNARYGATTADYNLLRSWAADNGFATQTFTNNLLVSVSGTAAQFERALGVFLIFRRRADGTLFISIDREPSLDLAVPILQISGLTSFTVPRVHAVTVNGTGVPGAGQPSSYRARDLRAAYLGGISPACTPLFGASQVVGLVEFAVFSASDVVLYDSVNGLTVPGNAPTVVLAEGGSSVPQNSQFEATLDVSMVQALAPAAKILVFQGNPGNGPLDTAYHAMATSVTPLTIASSSLEFDQSKNVQQALDEMAAQGTTFFQASGDFGDVGDPGTNLRLDNQTLVGGTFLSTNPAVPVPPYPPNYYAGETAWNQNAPQQQDATGGGVMDGIVKKGLGIGFGCFPCAPVDIPDYQIATQQQNAAANGGSTTARNYPDVALTAMNIEIMNGGGASIAAGTSAAAPLWAGFVALANDRQNTTGNGRFMGFINPTLYDIGQTRGTADDLYAETFNDIKDNSTNANGFGPGFPAVAGYDLVTGWGTPTCNLLTQLGSPAPLTDMTPLVELEFIIGTGGDNLRNHAVLTADVLLPDGITHLNATLHPDNSGEWPNNDSDNGGKPRTIGGFKVDKLVAMQITRKNPIKQATLTLTQVSCTGCTSENWDMISLTVNAFSGNSQRVCQISLNGNSTLDDGNPGLFRFKENFDPDCSNGTCGPNHTFAGGCP